jgi:hypothetical protein
MNRLVGLLEKIGSSSVHFSADKATFAERLSGAGLNTSAVDKVLGILPEQRDFTSMICMIWAPDEVPDIDSDIADFVEQDVLQS